MENTNSYYVPPGAGAPTNPHLIDRKDEKALKEWLRGEGWTVHEPVGECEIFRARRVGHPLIIFSRDGGRHLTTYPDDFGYLDRFAASRGSA